MMAVKKSSSSRVTSIAIENQAELAQPITPVVRKRRARKLKQSKPSNANKIKMARDSFTMPKDEYAQLKLLKSRLADLSRPTKKSELLRAGIMQLSLMTDAQLTAAMAIVPVIKTGRPKKT